MSIRTEGANVAASHAEARAADGEQARTGVQERLDVLFEEFRRDDELAAAKALERFKREGCSAKRACVEAAAGFLAARRAPDGVRTWATDLLEWLGGQPAFEALRCWFTACPAKGEFPYTRFFALRAMDRITRGPSATFARGADDFLELVARVEADEDEPPLTRAAALAILDADEDRLRAQLEAFARPGGAEAGYLRTWATLRALTEFPHPDLADELIAIVDASVYREHVRWAIRALGGCRADRKVADRRVIQKLGAVVGTNGRRDARLAAVHSLGRLGSRDATDSLLRALVDDDAEVRRQAAASLVLVYPNGPADIARLICDRAFALEAGEDGHLDDLADALRLVDARDVASEYLAAELDSDSDRKRRTAERILLQLGGRSAMRAFNRREVLQRLDRSLGGSEQAVQTNFEKMTLAAKRNYYFSLGVNALVVGLGLAVAVVGVVEIARDPGSIDPWLAASSGGGLLTAVVSEFLIGSRLRGRDDVRALARFQFVYLAFLHKLSQIDATFRRAYLEAGDFKAAHLAATLRQLDQSVEMAMAALPEAGAGSDRQAAASRPSLPLAAGGAV
jgi:HEAT repeat protein